MKFLRIAFLALLIASTSTGYAASISLADVDGIGCANLRGSRMCVTVLLEGTIERGDAANLRRSIDLITQELSSRLKTPVRVGKIHLNSTGGDLFEAMELGREIRSRMLASQITQDSVCYSACVISHLGGVLRIPIGPVGIHSFYSTEFMGAKNFDAASKKYNAAADMVTAYLKEMRVPASFLDEMMKVPHQKIRVLNFEEMDRLGVIGQDPLYLQIKAEKPNK